MSLHRWSGWPGAYCLDCFAEDPVELAAGTWLEFGPTENPEDQPIADLPLRYFASLLLDCPGSQP